MSSGLNLNFAIINNKEVEGISHSMPKFLFFEDVSTSLIPLCVVLRWGMEEKEFCKWSEHNSNGM
ncbi:CLUMA_CG003159, isoform A [Clunio marinus]|uniref:CLUMA_CG003159, isoform A n=1 Tax=Clunio marinus TaxID=568069 RepID=A0A1J1HPF2_9DIPT|nr:CLUMA_CG003159, isoform A [Clunio marinus]